MQMGVKQHRLLGIYILIELSGYIIIKMRGKEFQIQPKRRYAQISISVPCILSQRREIFVRGVLSEGLSISQAAKKYNIKLSTAKLIFKKYRETGMFFPKKIDRRRINHKKNECSLVEPIGVFQGFAATEAKGN